MRQKMWQGPGITRAVFFMLAICTVFTGPVAAQNPEMQQKIADLKQAAAMNKQALAQYTWVETDTISLKGEQKKQEHFQVRLGPDGKPQKTSLDPPPPPPDSDGGGRRGRLKEHVIEKKTDEFKEYAASIKTLIQQYVPPDKDKIQQAQQSGNITMGPAAGDAQFNLVISNYIKPGDKMTLTIDKAQKALASVSIATYLDDPKDAVTVNVQMQSIPGGPHHAATETINGVSKQLTIVVENSNYQKM